MAAGIGLGARFGGAEEHCPVGCAREPVFDHVVVLLAVVPALRRGGVRELQDHDTLDRGAFQYLVPAVVDEVLYVVAREGVVGALVVAFEGILVVGRFSLGSDVGGRVFLFPMSRLRIGWMVIETDAGSTRAASAQRRVEMAGTRGLGAPRQGLR